MAGLNTANRKPCNYAAPCKTKQLTVPFHAGKEVKKGLLNAILKQADIKTGKR